MYCRLSKCEFEKTEIEFLGLIISEGSIKVASEKIKAIVDEKPPRTKSGVR